MADGMPGSPPNIIMRHGNRPEMEDARVLHQFKVHFSRSQLHIGAGIAVKGKFTVSVFVNLNESQRRIDFPGCDET